jgi:hypothetical protein
MNHGRGKRITANGIIYKGKFVANTFEFGDIIWPDGKRYRGEGFDVGDGDVLDDYSGYDTT